MHSLDECGVSTDTCSGYWTTEALDGSSYEGLCLLHWIHRLIGKKKQDPLAGAHAELLGMRLQCVDVASFHIEDQEANRVAHQQIVNILRCLLQEVRQVVADSKIEGTRIHEM